MTLWYTARGAGLALLIALTVSTVLGALSSRKTAGVANRVVLQYVHRTCAVFGLVLLPVHIGAILADSYAHVGWLHAIIPFTSEYRPGSVALGSISAYLFITIGALGLARGRLATSERAVRNWRRVHTLAYALWATAIWHGFTAGTDSGVGWVRIIYLACAVSVPAALAVRLWSPNVLRPMEPVASKAPVTPVLEGAGR